MKQPIEFVYFDIGGVLVDLNGLWRDFFNLSSLELSKAREEFAKYDLLACRGELTVDEIREMYRIKLDIEIEDVENYFVERFIKREKMDKLVKKVASKYRVGLLSNIWGNLFQMLQDRDLIPDVDYECVVLSNLVKETKPNEGIYRIAAERVNCEGEKILLVDDVDENVAGARKMGWRGVEFGTDRVEESMKRIEEELKII